MEGGKTLCDIINIFMNRVCKKHQRLKKGKKGKCVFLDQLHLIKQKQSASVKRLNKKLFDQNTN